MKVIILIIMIFCHIVDDYYLQGWLASAKQKEWWKTNAPEDLYKYDYLIALFIHSFSWAFMVMIIPTIYYIIANPDNYLYFTIIALFIGNMWVHAWIDNQKANAKSINLIVDQLVHIFQIIQIWVLMVVINWKW